ncbi:hypothetical protein Tco_1109075 [Tanacetum coccineum]
MEAKIIAFEIALPNKIQENYSFKTMQTETENFVASLQIENTHSKQTYKDLFESIQSSRDETNRCDDVKLKFDFDEIETQNIELEHRVASLIKENEHLKFDNVFQKIESMKKKQFESQILNFLQKSLYDSDPSNVESDTGEKKIIFENETSSFETKIQELEMTLAKQTKYFKDAKSQDSNAEIDQFLKQIASRESKLASQDLVSNQKEYSELRTSYNALKAKFDVLNQDNGKSPLSDFSTPKVSVSKKIYMGESSKSFQKKVSQFTTYSVQKDRKFSKKPQVFETSTPQKVLNSRSERDLIFRIMPTKSELALEQTQQGVSNESLNIRAMLHSIHSDDGNPTSTNIKQVLRQVFPMEAVPREQNRNSSSPKCVHFINTITIIRKEEGPKKGGIIEPNAAKNNNHDIIEEKVGDELSRSEIVIGERESRVIKWDNPDDRAYKDTKEVDEVDEEREESEEEDDPEYFDTFPHCRRVRSEGLKSRRKPSNPEKISNFIRRVKGLKVCVGNFTYECDFFMLKDTTSLIDRYLGGMVLGKPFVKESRLVYDKDEGTVTFEKDNKKITFKMPHKMERC